MISQYLIRTLFLLVVIIPSLSFRVNAEITTRISGTYGGYDPSISTDGRYVAFISNAPNQSVVVHDRQTRTTEFVLTGPSDAFISGDGQYIVFASSGIAGDTTPFQDIFVYNRQTGITEIVSVANNGEQANSSSQIGELGSISADGRFVAFYSDASNLVSNDTNGTLDIFVRDRQTATTIRASSMTNGGLDEGVISPNGRFVAYRGISGVCFIYDLQTGDTEQLNETIMDQIVMSYDGRFVAFISQIDQPSLGDSNGLPDVFLHDRLTHITERVSVGAESDGYFLGGISSDGRFVSFQRNDMDIFVRDRIAGTTTLVVNSGAELAMSSNGRYIAFESSSAIESGDVNEVPDIYLRDLAITENLTGNLGPNGVTSSDTENDGATAVDIIETAIISPNPGNFSIEESPNTLSSPTGFKILDQQIAITAPNATADNPLRLVFRLDSSIIPPNQNLVNIGVFRNGSLVPTCSGVSGMASPDPCLLTTSVLLDNDIEITVLTSSASTWNFGLRVFAFNGFFQPVDNPPVLNVVKSGRSIPIKFRLGGNQGFDIFDIGYPKSQVLNCGTFTVFGVVEETITTGSSSLNYNPNIDQYTYVWKTNESWSGTCRRLVFRLKDNTEHIAFFRFE